MQQATFSAVCDVELGDEVRLNHTGAEDVISDIRTIHYLKAGKVEFEFEMVSVPGLWLERCDFVYTAKPEGFIDTHPDGQLTASEVVDLHTDGTICNQCGVCMDQAVGYARLCAGCESEKG